MTEEEFKKAMTKVIRFIIAMLVILVIVGIVVFNNFGKKSSIFENEEALNDYKKKVQETNSHNITGEEVDELENSSEFQENEESNQESDEENEEENKEESEDSQEEESQEEN